MFRREELQGVYALTPMQQGMLHHALLEPASPAYHEQLAACFEGPLDADALLAAWRWVVDRHEALRGRFVAERTSRPVHLTPHHESLQLSRYDSERSVGESLPPTVERYLAEDRARPFVLSQEHPMRLALFRCGLDLHWLVWSFHHILLDGWSIGIVLEEVLHAYRKLATGCAPELPPPPSYAQFQTWLTSRDQPAATAYWRQQLADYDQAGLLPVASVAPATASGEEPASYRIVVSGADWLALQSRAQRQRATVHHLLVAAWAVAVGRFGNRRDVVVGTVVAGRPAQITGADRLVGLCINTLPFRVHWATGDRFSQLLARVRDDHLAAAAHLHVSLAEFNTTQGAPVDHLFMVQNLPYDEVIGPITADCRLSRVVFRERTPYGLEVSATPSRSQLTLEWRYSPQVAPTEWVIALARIMERLLVAIVADPDQPLADLDVLGADRARVLGWGDGGAAPVERGTILELLAAAVAAQPDAPALVACDGSFTYRQLDQAADRLAQALLAQWPLQANDRVALVAERDSWLVIGLLAILKTGAAYVPIDPEFPAERVRLMLADSGCRLTLAAPGLLAAAPGPGPVFWLGAELPEAAAVGAARSGPDDLAYVIFTSGSTGRPKGTQILQRNVASFFSALPGVFGFRPQHRILALTTVSFDIAGLELLGALCCGLTVVLATAAQGRDPVQVFELLARHRIQVLQLTPTRLKLLLEAGEVTALAGVETLLVGGEALARPLADRLAALPTTRCFNVYGPTETTIWSSAQPLTGGPVTLGRPLPGERLLVLSAERRLQPVGAVGEIAIAGVGVGAGYLNQPDKTAERFVALPELVPGPVYLTGDLGRWRAEGTLEFLGRLDDQIKIRGVRVEPAEIEHHLRRQSGVAEAVVVARPTPTGEPELVAYVVSRDAALRARDPAAWRTRLAPALPEALIPARWMVLDALPQTPTGKIDRRALPDPAPAPTRAARAPATPAEQAIVAAFAAVLEYPVGPDEDFFASGGHSLTAMQAIGRINRELKSALRLKDLYMARTAATLAARVPTKPGAAPIPQAAEADDYPLSCAQEALWVLDQVNPGYTGYNIPGAYRLIGELQAEALHQAWAAVVGRHEALRTTFHFGPEGPRQRIHSTMDFTIEHYDCQTWSESAIAEQVANSNNRPFDLTTGPLFRLALLATGADTHIFVLTLHHIITDGWSDHLLVKDLASAYAAALAGRNPRSDLPPPPALRYRDFAVWQRNWLQGAESERHLTYWRERLSGLPLLELPTDQPRRARGHRSGRRISLAQGLPGIPASRRFAATVAATAALLHIESLQTDFCLGIPVSGRERPELQDQVGFHPNLLPLRLRFSASASLADLEHLAASVITAALEHAEYPFARLVEALGVATEAGRHPLFDAFLILHHQPVPLLELAGLQVELAYMQSYTSRCDLDFEAWVEDAGITGFIEYDADLFGEARMAVLVSRWGACLRAVQETPEMTLTGLRRDIVSGDHPATAHFIAQALAVNEDF